LIGYYLCLNRFLLSVFDCAILAVKYDLNYTLNDFKNCKSTDANEKDDLYCLLNVVYHQGEHNQVDTLTDGVLKEGEKLPDVSLVQFKFHHYKEGEKAGQDEDSGYDILVSHWGLSDYCYCDVGNGINFVFGRGDGTEMGEPEES